MTYFGVLLTFIVPPLLLLLIWVPRDLWRWLSSRRTPVDWRAYGILVAHVVIALAYTTPWDNYLVATGVWWYDPQLVTGLKLGWVPLEEYVFFILQTLLTGLWLLGLRQSALFHPHPAVVSSRKIRLASAGLALGIGLVSLLLWISGVESLTYLSLILAWAMLPIMIQVFFGADILLANRRLLVAAVLPTTLYLWLVDALAIRSGTWTIDPGQTTGIKLAGLPIEEMLFFFITNLIIAFGMTLMLSPFSQERARKWYQQFRLQSKQRIERVRYVWTVMQTHNGLWSKALIFWVMVLIATPLWMWGFGERVFPFMTFVGVLAQFSAVLFALLSQWSGRRIMVSFVVILVITWGMEFLGSSTGVPFGSYHYTPALQPQLGGVPLLIPLAWFMMLFPAWAFAETILSPLRQRLSWGYWWVFAVFAGLVFTAWDFYLDPQMVARGLWQWEQSGGYFGIPWSNYVGWWFTAALLTLLLRPQRLPRIPLMVIYTLTWAFQVVGLGIFWGQPGPAVVGFLAMGLFVTWGWYLEGKKWNYSSGHSLDFSAAQSHTH